MSWLRNGIAARAALGLPMILLGASAAVLGTPAAAQDSDPDRPGGRAFEHIELRVSSVRPGGEIVVDRGLSDGLEVGDPIVLQPRTGGQLWATVTQVLERTSIARLSDPRTVPPPGTRGRVRIPKRRLDALRAERAPAPVEPDDTAVVPEDPNATGAPSAGAGTEPQDPADAGEEHPPWQNQDEEWVEGQPLLTQIEVVPPDQRASSFTGRVYSIADLIVTTDDRTDGFYRAGADLLWENLFGHGGQLHFDGELNYRHALRQNADDEASGQIRLDRLSYAWGGTRQQSHRLQGGRFLQYGMPEFGVLDGAEWTQRRGNGHRFGASAGWMPEPDQNHETGRDFQVAGWYEWVADPSEELSIAGGYQKTFHGGAPDRDLLVARMHWLPPRGWNANAVAYVDLYSASDDERGSGAGLTHAFASLRRNFKDAGVNFTYAHQELPELDRNEFTFVPGTTDIDDARVDRLAASGWTRIGRDTSTRGHLAGWVDEDDAGADAEVALTVDEVLLAQSRADVALFTNIGSFTKSLGARITYSQTLDRGRWSMLYEFANHRLNGFNANNDDILQHRLRGSHELYTDSGWTFSWYVEGVLWSNEVGGICGLYLQRSF